jgi:hypothetical protein
MGAGGLTPGDKLFQLSAIRTTKDALFCIPLATTGEFT